MESRTATSRKIDDFHVGGHPDKTGFPRHAPSAVLPLLGARSREWAALSLVLIFAGTILFFNLGAKYLWQDEAATAVLGIRLFTYGKPLAYDGLNLITMDHFAQEDTATVDARTGNPEAAIRYYVNRGDFKPDTAWTGQPWGQFAVAGASVALFGRNTWAARAPFAAAALLTVALLYVFVKTQFKDPFLALLSAVILLANVYWIIHSRQCRYYSLSSLFLVITIMAFARWQAGRAFGSALFVAAAWCWFQVDFGSFWPVVAILFAMAFIAAWPRVQHVMGVWAALALAVAPWVWYYELAGRLKVSAAPWTDKFLLNLFHLNQFVIPLAILLLAAVILTVRWKSLPEITRLILAAGISIIFFALVWIPTVTPAAFHRYIVNLSPLAALITAWLLMEGVNRVIRIRTGVSPHLLAGAVTAFLVFSPILSNIVSYPLQHYISTASLGDFTRPEWNVLREEVFMPRLDPNRIIIETLKKKISPKDEILINYEDIPLMFYLNNPIRGGISSFRAEDSSRVIPRFLVYRQSVNFVHTPVFQREISRYKWRPERSGAPDIPWGNIPEPEMRIQQGTLPLPDIIFAENMGLAHSTAGDPKPDACRN